MTNICEACSAIDNFKRERTIIEVEHLDVDEDGTHTTHCDDQHVQDEWQYECVSCGASSSDLEDLLADEEDEDDDDSYEREHGSLSIGERNPSLATRRF